MRGSRYVLDDDRVTIRGKDLLFTRRARGTPGNAHGGSIGAVYAALVPENSQCIAKITVVFKSKTYVEMWSRIEILEKGTKAQMWRGNELLSQADLILVPTLARKPLSSPAALGAVCMENVRTQHKDWTRVRMPDFEVARAITPERLAAGYSHFEFHNKPRMIFQETLLNADAAQETAETISVLYVSPFAGSDRAGVDRVAEGALWTAADEIMGATVNKIFFQPLVTGSLQLEYYASIGFEYPGASVALYLKTSVRRAAPDSRRVLVQCDCYTIGPKGEPGVKVMHAESTFVLLEGKL